MKRTYLASLALALLLSLAACGVQQAPEAPVVVNHPVAVSAPVVEVPVVPVVAPKVAAPKKTKKPAPVAKKQTKKQKPVAAPKVKPVDEVAARRDCTGDAFQFCAWAMPMGRDSVIKCMVSNRTKLSKQCQAHVK